jgi:DNA repair exonuclease SbcCD ATPase subunit
MDKNHDMYRKLEKEHFRLKNNLQQSRAECKKLKADILRLREALKDVKTGNSSKNIKELKEQMAEQEKINMILHDAVYNLEQEKKQLVQSKGMVSQSEYDGLLKQLERERQSKEQYKRLYEQEKTKRNELKESFKTDNENKTVIYPDIEENQNLVKRIKELEDKLSRKGTGRPRNNKASDEDVLKLRNEGKRIREICHITGMSTATVVKVLKRFNAGNS